MKILQKSKTSSLAGVAALGFAIGATAVGALAIGALAIGRLAIRQDRIDKLSIGELAVDKLVIMDQIPPAQKNGFSAARGVLVSRAGLEDQWAGQDRLSGYTLAILL